LSDNPAIRRIDLASALSTHRFRYYDFAMVATCVIVVCSNVIGAGKVAQISIPVPFRAAPLPFTFGAGILFFPLSYVLGDVLTEVYGYARARRVIWTAFVSAAFAAAAAAFIVAMPPAPEWNVKFGNIDKQAAFTLEFGQAPRIIAASCLAIWVGEFVNAFVLARMKILTGGRHLWQRTIGSTIAGQAADTVVFYPLAFAGIWSGSLLVRVMVANYALKVSWEALLTPLTYRVVAFLKRAEGVDVYDNETDFTPFTF